MTASVRLKRRLLLLRHAKSDWDAPLGDDHSRPLAPRGRRAAATIGRWLAAVDRVPDMIVTSSAVRARSTVELAAAAGGWTAPIEISDELYGAGPEGVLEVLRRRGGSHSTVLLAGHEPVWSALAGGLVGGARLRFPTAAMASLRFAINHWSDAEAAELEWLITPKLLERFEARSG